MQKIRISISICLAVFYFAAEASAQNSIMEAAYLKQDSLLWADYQNQMEVLETLWETLPDKRDSLQTVSDQLYEKTAARNIELAVQYATTPSGLQRLYMVRLDIAKDSLQKILNALPVTLQESFYGRNIQAHLETEQIEKGDSVFPFPCLRDDGTSFDWSDGIKGKQVLLLYGGLGCMGNNGREYLKQLRKRISPNDLEILIYWPCDSLQKLREIKGQFPEFTFISDFKYENSPIKIKYGTQATPTCFLTDKRHVVIVKCTGVHPELFDPHLP